MTAVRMYGVHDSTQASVQCLQSACSHAHLATTSTFHLIGCEWFIRAHLAMCNLHSHLFVSVRRSPVHTELKPARAMTTEQLTRSIAVPARQCLCGAGGMAWPQSPSSQDDEHRTTSIKTGVIQHQDRCLQISLPRGPMS